MGEDVPVAVGYGDAVALGRFDDALLQHAVVAHHRIHVEAETKTVQAVLCSGRTLLRGLIGPERVRWA